MGEDKQVIVQFDDIVIKIEAQNEEKHSNPYLYINIWSKEGLIKYSNNLYNSKERLRRLRNFLNSIDLSENGE